MEWTRQKLEATEESRFYAGSPPGQTTTGGGARKYSQATSLPKFGVAGQGLTTATSLWNTHLHLPQIEAQV